MPEVSKVTGRCVLEAARDQCRLSIAQVATAADGGLLVAVYVAMRSAAFKAPALPLNLQNAEMENAA